MCGPRLHGREVTYLWLLPRQVVLASRGTAGVWSAAEPEGTALARELVPAPRPRCILPGQPSAVPASPRPVLSSFHPAACAASCSQSCFPAGGYLPTHLRNVEAGGRRCFPTRDPAAALGGPGDVSRTRGSTDLWSSL